MVHVYIILVREKIKNIEDVPDRYRDAVKKALSIE